MFVPGFFSTILSHSNKDKRNYNLPYVRSVKQRDNTTLSNVTAINVNSEIVAGKGKSSMRSKAPPVGIDKKHPKALVAKNFILPEVLQPEHAVRSAQHPFLSAELGGNTLNLNHVYNSDKASKKVMKDESNHHVHIDRFLDGFREAPVPNGNIQVSLFPPTTIFEWTLLLNISTFRLSARIRLFHVIIYLKNH